MAHYLPLFRRQIGDPTTTRDANLCTMSAGAMALDYHTLGKVQVWGGELEARQSDHIGGTGLDDLAEAWRAYGETFEYRSGASWADVRLIRADGRCIVLQGDYEAFPAGVTCQASFTGTHAILVHPDAAANGAPLVGDPLCGSFHGVPEAVLADYAGRLAGTGRAHFGWTRPQPSEEVAMSYAPPTRQHYALAPSSPFYWQPGGGQVGLLTRTDRFELAAYGTRPDGTLDPTWALIYGLAPDNVGRGNSAPARAAWVRADRLTDPQPIVLGGYTADQLDQAVAEQRAAWLDWLARPHP